MLQYLLNIREVHLATFLQAAVSFQLIFKFWKSAFVAQCHYNSDSGGITCEFSNDFP